MTRVKLAVFTALFVLGGAAALAVASTGGSDTASHGHASAGLRDLDGERVGRVFFIEHHDRVYVEVRVRDQTAGFHGFHVHETGVCEPPFESAGGHLAAAGEPHPDHIGDLPVLQVGAGGRSYQVTTTDRFSVGDLFDADGSAVIVHADPDNYSNIPERYTSSLSGEPGPDAETLAAGDSGDRVACGVVR
jgi:Cu-Zn family superoxide dismutase